MVMPNFYTGPSGFHRGDSAKTSLPETLAQILEIRRENLRRSGDWEAIQRDRMGRKPSRLVAQGRVDCFFD